MSVWGSHAIGAVIVAAGLAAGVSGAAAQSIIINRLDDMPLGTWTGSGNMTQTMNHCVGPSTATFRVTATGSGTGGAFTLSNGVTALPYRLEYRDRTGSFQVLAPGVALTGRTGDTQAQCVNMTRESERLRVTLLAADLTAATAGNYSGTVTLTVAPE